MRVQAVNRFDVHLCRGMQVDFVRGAWGENAGFNAARAR